MKHTVCITMGDPSGIGSEITVKALAHKTVTDHCVPIVIGDKLALEDAIQFTGIPLKLNKIVEVNDATDDPEVVNYIDLGYLTPGSWQYKKVCRSSGEAAFGYIRKGIDLAMDRKVDAVVTGPINKEAMNLAGYHFAGHTEIFAHYTHTKTFSMLLTSKELRVMHVTTHVSMREACRIIRSDSKRVENTIRLAQEAMLLLGIKSPRIAVAGLNAHCSENGLFGDEEQISIIPAIIRCREDGINVDGPVPPDTVFVKAQGGQYDVVVAMYHDQGHIPLKQIGFKLNLNTGKYENMSGVNATIGLPIIRTSVDHGTAFGKAGEGRANEESMVDAILMAVQMADVRFPQS